MIKNPTISNKIKLYSAITAGLMASGKSAKADIIYKDINPDTVLAVKPGYNYASANYSIDLNADGIADLSIFANNDYGSLDIEIIAPPNNRLLLGSKSGAAGKLDFGTLVSASASYTANSTGHLASSYATYDWNGGVTDKYVGVRFQVGTDFFYGWVPLDVSSDVTSVTIKSFAYENIANTGILAGATQYAAVQSASMLSAADIGDNNNASDIQLGFNKASDETGISSYRVFAVPAASASSFDLAAAMAVPLGSYYDIAPDGSNISAKLPPALFDTDGNPISQGKDYSLFVLSVGSAGHQGALSLQSNLLTLSSQVQSASVLIISDEGNEGDASDIHVAFNKASDETGISAYRILVVPASASETFGIADAEAVASESYYDVAPDGSDPSLTLPSALLSTNGNNIVNGAGYAVFVLSVGSNGYQDSLSAASNMLTLVSPVPVVSKITAVDHADNKDASDIEVYFTKAPDETNISSYRVFVVPAQDADTFNVNSTQYVDASSYYDIDPDGSNPSFALPAALLSTEGKKITNGPAYVIFVMSVGQSGYTGSIASDNNFITLSTIVSSVSDISASDQPANGDASDIQITFSNPADETGISKYRVMVVPAEEAALFDVNNALAIESTSYYEITPDGMDQSFNLPAGLLSTDGEEIALDITYKIFVLSVPDQTYTASLAESSSSITLSAVTAVDGGSVTNAAMYVYGNELIIRNAEEATLEIYNESGTKLLSKVVTAGENHVDVSHIENLFIAHLLDNGKIQTGKFSKE